MKKATFKDINVFDSKLWINDSMGCKGYRQTVIDSISRVRKNIENKYTDTNFVIKYFGYPEYTYTQGDNIVFSYFNDYIHKNPCQPIKDLKDAEYHYDMIGASLDFHFGLNGKLIYSYDAR